MTGTRTSILTETLHRHWCLCMCEPWVSEDPSYCLSIASYAFTYVNKFPHSLKNKKTIRHFSFPHFLHLAYHPTKKDKTYLEDPIYRALFCRSSRSSSNTVQLTHTQTYKDAPTQPHLLPLVYSPAYQWHEGSACSPYRTPAAEAPA